MMEKEDIYDLDFVKRLTTANMANDIRTWLGASPERERKDFAAKAGISLRTLDSILAYDGSNENEKEPNWTRETQEGIMKALACESFYTPKHEIK